MCHCEEQSDEAISHAIPQGKNQVNQVLIKGDKVGANPIQSHSIVC